MDSPRAIGLHSLGPHLLHTPRPASPQDGATGGAEQTPHHGALLRAGKSRTHTKLEPGIPCFFDSNDVEILNELFSRGFVTLNWGQAGLGLLAGGVGVGTVLHELFVRKPAAEAGGDPAGVRLGLGLSRVGREIHLWMFK